MKNNKKKPFLNMDERNRQMAYKVMAVMYIFTILALQGILLYKQLILGQQIERFEDIAVIVTINSLFLISALLYFGAIPLQKIKIKTIILVYFLLVIVGIIFTWLKYNVFQGAQLSVGELFDKLIIVAAILGILMGFFVLLLWLGKRRIEKELK